MLVAPEGKREVRVSLTSPPRRGWSKYCDRFGSLVRRTVFSHAVAMSAVSSRQIGWYSRLLQFFFELSGVGLDVSWSDLLAACVYVENFDWGFLYFLYPVSVRDFPALGWSTFPTADGGLKPVVGRG